MPNNKDNKYEFLSQEWVEGLNAALAREIHASNGEFGDGGGAADGGAENSASLSENLVISYVIKDQPKSYHLICSGSEIKAVPGLAEKSTISYTQTYKVASGIAKGEMNTHIEMLMGHMEIEGDVTVLEQYRPVLEIIQRAASSLRDKTRF